MSFVAVVLGAALWAAALSAERAPGQQDSADTEDSAAAGYDHVWHEGRVAASGHAGIACARCHPVDAGGHLRGRPDHSACFGDCHGPAPRPRPRRRRRARPYAIAEDVQRVCQACHAPADLDALQAGTAGRVTVAYPPYAHDPDHGVTMSHAAHDQPSRDRGDCTACHTVPPDPGTLAGAGQAKSAGAHARCAGCHGAGEKQAGAPEPAMSQCQGCHVPAYGPRTRPFLVRGAYPVHQTFTHRSHMSRGATCRTCHAGVAASASTELPAPTMAVCQTCHDGDQAFSAVATHCRRCHTRPPARTRLRPALDARYDHAAHDRIYQSRGTAHRSQCDQCHIVDARGVPRPPAASHAPCSDAGCHADEFSSPAPTICGACHVGTEPWRPLHFDRAPVAATAFGARFSHRAHMQERGMERGCDGCHGRARGTDAMRLSRDHTSCMGAGCHFRAGAGGAAGGAAPSLSECAACHEPGLSRARRERRMRARWSVRARFRHPPHRTAPGTERPVACTSCHVGVEEAERVADIPTPSKDTCRPCHDGQAAFKVTGHGCARCHGSAQSDTPAP